MGLVERITAALFGNRELFNRLSNSKSITIAELLSEFFSGDATINLYPGIPNGSCCETAVFISLSKQPNPYVKLKEDQMVPLQDMLIKMAQKVLGDCKGVNKKVYFLTDRYSTEEIKPWSKLLFQLKKELTEFEIYDISTGKPFSITQIVTGL